MNITSESGARWEISGAPGAPMEANALTSNAIHCCFLTL